MVLTRSKDGEQAKRRQEELNALRAVQEASSEKPPAQGTSNAATETTGTSSGISASTATEASTSTGTEDTSAASQKERTSQHTLRPADARSRRSVASRKKLLAELEAKERLAELKLKQAQIQAETEIQQLRVQRLQAEADASDDDVEEEEIEDDLASVRISTWLKDTEPNQPQSAQRETHQEEAKKTQEDHVEAKKKQEDSMKTSQPLIDVATLAAALSQAVRSTREPPKYIQELPPFNGSSTDWLGFKTAYEETLKYFTQNENIARIRRSLRGTAKEAVGCLLVSQPDPRVVIEALERRFGRPEALIHVEMEKLKSLNRVSDNPRDLCIFAGRIANIVGTIEALKKPQYLHSPEMARTITEKLTPILKSKWYDYAATKKESTPELKKISTFLNEEADKCGAYALPEATVNEIGERDRKNRRTERTFAMEKKTSSEDQCPQCKQDHKLPDCKQFSALDTNARWEVAKKNHICYRCLRSKHRRLQCKSPPCGRHGCAMRHHKLLHHDKEQSSTSDSEKKEMAAPAVEVTSAAKPGNRRRAYLKIAPVIIKGPHSSIETYALLDEGSTITLLDASIADVIGADGPENTMWIQGIGNEMKHDNSKVVSLSIRGKYAEEEYQIEAARTVNRLSFTPETVYHQHLEDCEHLIDIKDQITYQHASPKLLIGQDNWQLIVSRKLRTGRRNQPVASLTQLGWVLHGCHSSVTDKVAFCGRLQQKEEEPTLEELVKNHFRLESLCIEPRKPKEDPEQKAIQILEETSRRLPEGRFETGLLWKEKDRQIPNNYNEAERRLRSLEKRLDKDEDLKQKYEERMDNLFQSGYAEPAPTPAPEGKTWYLPHFPVINPAKPHKPPRLVHDASAKAAGICLNDMLYSGPDLLQSLPGVIMRFRQHAYAVSGDIKEMFMQVKIRAEDRDALRFLWRGKRREDKPEEYRMTSVIFGATSSPCTALFIKNKNASEFANDYPEAAAAIQKNHYMDDYVQSFSTILEARQITKAVDFIHKKAGFVLNGWTSNDTRIIEEFGLPEEDNATTVSLGGKDTEKTLGLLWHVKEDCIGFNTNSMKIPSEVEENRRSPTKREALSIIMALFDPLGLISPITTPAKRIFQDTWRYKTDWDDPLPDELEEKWKKWITSLSTIKQLRIPRCYDYGQSTSRQLHTFVDASEEAYAAAVYWRTEREDGSVHVSLAAAKSRVTPLKPVSMPRLELQAALLGARLAQTVIEEHDYKVQSKTYWSDSRTALVWIRSEPRVYKSFVAHRLAEIEETTKKNEWRWLPSKDNVADDATRDTPDHFDATHRWYQGPSFLKLPESQWPKEENVVKYDTGEEREKCHSCQQEDNHNQDHLPKIERFSKWLRLIRTTARVLQFIDLCKIKRNTVTATRKRTKKTEAKDPDWRIAKKPPLKQVKKVAPHDTRSYREIPVTYLTKAEQLWVRASQQQSFRAEIERIKRGDAPSNSDRLSHLSVYIDADGTVRLRGRVAAAQEIAEDTSNPPILDGKQTYTRLYIAHVHERLHHGGVEMVVNELRQRLWISKIRPAVRNIIKSCLPCRIRKMKPASPLTGDLPPARLAHHARPFTFTGLDYFGPIEVTVGRHHEKRYGALFTCMTSRAIHIEIVYSLSADSAVSALRRFMARRGCPKELWSDNATCFKAADKELGAAALEALEHETACHHITWKYIPPAAPFMGGTWERMVRSVKEALKITLKERYPSDETLVTLLTEVENTVNSRPLTHVSVDPQEPEALTPNQILIGPNSHVPVPGHFEEKDVTARQQWKRAQVLADIFWRRWVKEYMPLLQHRREPTSTGTQPKIGDLVIICDGNLPRNIWPRGRVSQLHPGADGEVRVVDVTISGGHVLRRPTRKVIVLPTESQRGDGGRMCTTP